MQLEEKELTGKNILEDFSSEIKKAEEDIEQTANFLCINKFLYEVYIVLSLIN